MRARLLKLTGLLIAAVLTAGLIAPRMKADRYRGRIERSLTEAFGRRVTFGEVRLNLLGGAGFTIRDVAIAEDPALGFEPVAYVDRLIATPRLLSLLTGQLVFSSVRLEDAHLNLARADLPGDEYRWNLESLLRPSLLAAFPNIAIHGARINFKAANVKSPVYLLDSDLFIDPPSGAGAPWRFRFEGKPARADRPARGSGVVRARGTWKPGMLDATLQLERSELGDVIAVLRGEDAGLHGLVSGNAHFAGPLTRVLIDGHLRVEELHGWDQDIPKGEVWPLEIRGSWNSQAQQLELDGRVAGKGNTPLAVHYLVAQYLTQPRWGATLQLSQFPAGPLVSLARHLGLALSPGLEVSGTLDGAIGYSAGGGFAGQARLAKAALKLPGSPALEFAEANLVVMRGVARLLPLRFSNAGQGEAVTEADYDLAAGRGRFRISARHLDVAALTRQLPSGAIPVLSLAADGTWSGALEWNGSQPAESAWKGDITLANTSFATPALASPISVESAECHLDGDAVTIQKIRAHVAEIPIAGDYRYQPSAAHPHRFRLTVGRAQAGVLEAVLQPTLRRSREVLGVDLPFGRRALPPWLAAWHAEGTIAFDAIETELWSFSGTRARFQWDAGRILVSELASGAIAAHGAVDLRGPVPAYEFMARVQNQEWKGGQLSLDAAATLQSGTLRAQGNFSAVEAEEALDHLTGQYALTWRDRTPRITLSALRLQSSNEIYTGKGSLRDDGTVLLELNSPSHQARVTGPLIADSPLRWEGSPAHPH